LRREPAETQASNNLALILERRGQFREAAAILRAAVARDPDQVVLLYNLSWLLATAPDDAVRDGPKAVKLAQRLVERTSAAEPLGLDALAAAYAEIGQFDEAVQTATEAARLAEERAATQLAEQIHARRQLYFAGKPFRVAGQTTDGERTKNDE
jgi:tetratricopeptide (TPR) repeat protein